MHRDYAHLSGIAACFLRVFPSRNEEDVRSGTSGADRLLLEAPDGDDRAVEAHLSARDHLVAAVDVVAELLGDVQGEGEACRRAADPAGTRYPSAFRATAAPISCDWAMACSSWRWCCLSLWPGETTAAAGTSVEPSCSPGNSFSRRLAFLTSTAT